ncbi:hypothetical protein SGL43_05461 [Streptomyces globisporus]|uniref:Uncharacterized protein n=1 Tax=Streptomyces globisporus TaxID=1908 RepID=A0ABM9H451_STRGL|nr:hypothetical protein SGL43_05461 [Streptomyces globisporus]
MNPPSSDPPPRGRRGHRYVAGILSSVRHLGPGRTPVSLPNP